METGLVRIWIRLLLASALFCVTLGASASLYDLAQEPRPVRLDRTGWDRTVPTVRLSWDALPPEVCEFEILVESELPQPLLLRLTECEDPSLTELEVEVPSLPSPSARFLIRAGSERGERILAASAPWRTPRGEAATPSHAVLRDGELWIAEGEGFPGAGTLSGGRAHVAATPPTVVPARTSPHARFYVPLRGAVRLGVLGAERASARRGGTLRPPAEAPLRI